MHAQHNTWKEISNGSRNDVVIVQNINNYYMKQLTYEIKIKENSFETMKNIQNTEKKKKINKCSSMTQTESTLR